MTPHERPITGPAADFATALSGQLPQLETARLCLRAPRLEDFEAWAEIFCGPAGLHLGGPFDRDDAFTEFVASCGLWLLRGHGLWTVEPKAGGAVLGFVLIGFEPGDQEPELGYLFRPVAEGQGYATEAAAALRDHAFATLGLTRLVSYISPGNIRSVQVARRLLARHTGELDDIQIWLHQPGAHTGVSTPAQTQGSCREDGKETVGKGL